MKILFLVKSGLGSGGTTESPRAGLINSATFTANTLYENIWEVDDAAVKICVDANSIDKEVTEYKPNLCIIEALWVTPAKMQELVNLHPKVKFVIRVHSNIPFLSNEGIAIEWLKGYQAIEKLDISFNNYNTVQDFKHVGVGSVYLPNLYKIGALIDLNSDELLQEHGKYAADVTGMKFHKEELNIGCFGAIRPLKNQLIQAVAAVSFADQVGTKLNFHMNTTRVEQAGENTLRNIKALFNNTKHTLVDTDWLTHKDFLHKISKMDIGMQLSLTESFNIVTADFVSQKVPIIVSNEISWMPELAKVSATSIDPIVKRIDKALKFKKLFALSSVAALDSYNDRSEKDWVKYLKNVK